MSALAAARRIVVKVGSALVVDAASGAADARLAGRASPPTSARLQARGQQVLVVSSGAVALGRRRLALQAPRADPAGEAGRRRRRPVAADAGLGGGASSPHGLIAAQVLLTRDDTEVRRRWLNARATVETLLELGVTPVVNENDTVATEEIRYGDNDRLAARVAQMVGADLLVLLSDVDGLYTADPRRDPAARHIPARRAR